MHQLLIVGQTGAGKTTQELTLPKPVFSYVFDPAALATLKGYDIEYEPFLPDVLELDATIKKFNKDARPSDQPASAREPKTYVNFVRHLNEFVESGEIRKFKWIAFDSITMMSKSIMDRQLWINKRYGEVEDIADFKIVGAKLSDIFRSINNAGVNIYCTGHVTTFQDDKTKKISTELDLPGRAKRQLPLMFSSVLEAYTATIEDKPHWFLATVPSDRGLQTVRTSFRGLETEVDVTIDFTKPLEGQGIGGILQRAAVSNGAPTNKRK